MTADIFQLAGISFLLVALLMTCFWVIYLKTKNAGVVDIAWSLGFALTGMTCLIFGEGDLFKRIFLTVLILIWSLRLGWHLLRRFEVKREDPRYTEIKTKWGEKTRDIKMYLMFLFQGFLVVFLSLPFMIVATSSTSEWHLTEALGFLLWLAGFWGEALSDKQLFDFKKKRTNTGKICQEGLWRLSRHPNYFFEWVIWWGYFFIAVGSNGGIYAITSPLLMWLLLTRISGVPLAEKESLKSHGEAYREYQRKTNRFIPWPF
jgi:steroid 5-alpha reductase family enzyme